MEKIEGVMVVLELNNMMYIYGVLIAVAIACLSAKIANKAKHSNNNKNKISFKESLDLTNLPVIILKQGDKKVNLLLDTGSTRSVILPSVLETLEHKVTGEVGTVYGMEGVSYNTKYAEVELFYNNIMYNESFQVVDMSNAFNSIKQSTGVNIHGILGNSFFERYGYIIDFQELVAYGKDSQIK